MDKPMGELIAACEQALRALRLTREYVGPAVPLPAIPGWSWYDATLALESALTNAAAYDDEMKATVQRYKVGLISEREYNALINLSDDYEPRE